MIAGSVALIIPCYNEAAVIGEFLRELLAADPRYCPIVIDDASQDATAAEVTAVMAESSRVTLLRLPCNLGIGKAVQTGFRHAAAHAFAYAVKVDGDGQHPAGEIGKLLEPLQTDRADVVIGSRFLNPADGGFKSTWARRIGIRFFSWLVSALTGQRITDSTSGFRAYNARAIGFAATHCPAFDYPEPEEVVLMHRNRFRLCEVPVRMQERQAGHSSINLRRSVCYMGKVPFACLMAAVRPTKKGGI